MVMSKKRKQEVIDRRGNIWRDMIRLDSQRNKDEGYPIFFSSGHSDTWGYLDFSFNISGTGRNDVTFLGPSEHPHDQDSPECEACAATRKRFFSVEQYDHYSVNIYGFKTSATGPTLEYVLGQADRVQIEYYKARFFGDKPTAEAILTKSRTDPYPIRGFHQESWDDVSYDVMVQANMWKFAQDNRHTVYTSHNNESYVEEQTFRDALLFTGGRSLVASTIGDDEWRQLQVMMACLRDPEISNVEFEEMYDEHLNVMGVHNWEDKVREEPRNNGVNREKWGNNVAGRVLMDVRARMRSGEKPRMYLEYRSLSD